MADPLPRWGKALFALVLLAGVGAFWLWPTADPDPEPAAWRVSPTARLRPDSRVIPIVVHERNCASGQDARGRIEVDVTYAAESVRLAVGVRPRGGDQDCQGNPDTPHAVELREALGERKVSGQTWPSP